MDVVVARAQIEHGGDYTTGCTAVKDVLSLVLPH
jgi:hypothetical protein